MTFDYWTRRTAGRRLARPAMRTLSSFQNLTGLEVKSTTAGHLKIVSFSLRRSVAIVVEPDLTLANHLGRVAGDYDRRRFVDADAEQLRVELHEPGHVGRTLAGEEVLVYGAAGQVAESALVPLGGHDRVPERVPAGHVFALDRRSGRAATDHPAAVEHFQEPLRRQSPLVGIDEPPLPAAAEPDAFRHGEHLRELRVVGRLAVAGVE